MSDYFIEIDGKKIEYHVERKKTNTIKYKVFPDLSVKIIVPETITNEEIQKKVEKRKYWIKRSLEFYSKNQDQTMNELQSGSTIYYLGKQYRLKVVVSKEQNIKLSGKFLIASVRNKDSKQVSSLVDEWYRSHAYFYFNKVVVKLMAKLGKYDIQRPDLFVRKFKRRWGSCIQNKNKIVLNLDLIKEHSYSIEYVIMHELCHLKYPRHDKSFYTFLTIMLPDWQYRKKKLERLLL